MYRALLLAFLVLWTTPGYAVECIIAERPDGGVRIIIPTAQWLAVLQARGMTRAEAVQAVSDKDAPKDALSVQTVQCDTLPQDRRFRNAWVRGGDRAVVDMPKARVIHKARIMAARDVEVEARIKAFVTAQIDNNIGEQNRLRGEINALKGLDMSAGISAATTPDALDAIWPGSVPRP